MTLHTPDPAGTISRPEHPALQWWRQIRDPKTGDPGAVARLRRSRSILDVLQVREAIVLARRLGMVSDGMRTADWRVRAALDLSRVLAHIREHDPLQHPMRAAGWKRFAGGRKESDAGEDRPRLAEARFRRLIQTGGGEEKVAAFTRLVAQLGGTVKVDDLARDFLHWNHPEHGDRIRERWAFLYYAAAVDAAPPLPSDSAFDTPAHINSEENA